MSPSFAAYQQGITFDSGAGSVSSVGMTFTSNVQAGSLIILAIGWNTGGHYLAGVTDNQGTSWSESSFFGPTPITGFGMDVLWTTTVAAGSFTVTIPFGGPVTFVRALLHEYTGVGAYDLGHIGVSYTGSTATDTLHPTTANDFIFAFCVDNNGVSSYVAPAVLRLPDTGNVAASGDLYDAGPVGPVTITANTLGGGGGLVVLAWHPGTAPVIPGGVSMSATAGLSVLPTTVGLHGELLQTSPYTDSVQDTVSEMYENQLTCQGATPPITWTTIESTGGFLVAPSGRIGTQIALDPGTYTASGTMQDSLGNPGIWSFTLTVYTNPTPETTVIPTDPTPWTGIEIMVPFQIDSATGQVAVIQDYAATLEQHVLTILLTSTGERVMLPTYGASLEQQIFQPITALTSAALQSTIEEKIAEWEPAVSLVSVEVGPDPNFNYVLNVTVTFTAANFPGVKTVVLGVGGAYPTISISQIGPLSP